MIRKARESWHDTLLERKRSNIRGRRVWPIREVFGWRAVIFRADQRVCGRLAAELWAVCVVQSGESDSGAV